MYVCFVDANRSYPISSYRGGLRYARACHEAGFVVRMVLPDGSYGPPLVF